MSKLSELLRALIDGTEVEIVPTTKAQTYLVACINGTGSEGLPEPTTVLGGLLCELADKLAGGGGGGGTEPYVKATYDSNAKMIGVELHGYSKVMTNMFNGNRDLISASMPGVAIIEGRAFASCSGLASMSLPSGLLEIYASAFSYCSNMVLTTIPSSVTTIGNYAFERCYGITELTFEGTPQNIWRTAFSECDNLLDIYVPWSEGEVANAPWGATNATIHYNSEV